MCTNIMLLPTRHPLDVAEEINTLNELSNNRFILGAGIGYRREEFENAGWNFKTRARRFEECLEILRLALTGKEFTYEGAHFRVPPCTVFPSPHNHQATPLWIGAVSDPAMQRAGRLGDGWLVSFAEHLLELENKVARYKAIATSYGRPSTICLMRDLHIASTRAELDPDWLPNVIRVWQRYDELGSKADRDPLADKVIFGGKAIDLEQFAPNRALVGTPDDCIRELERIRARLNPEYLLLTPTGVPNPEQQVRELRLFAKEVMPNFPH
jgi:alkanesulfonate monooxygenase SsuD/methylene tetrahydromethanopterin reductase-like flavin-dependent oxidoreductase (luciferase family)